MSDRKIRWAPRLEPGDHISGCDYLGLRELDSSSVDTLLQLSVRWSSLVLATASVAMCQIHWQRLRSADVASTRLRSLLTSTVVWPCACHHQHCYVSDTLATQPLCVAGAASTGNVTARSVEYAHKEQNPLPFRLHGQLDSYRSVVDSTDPGRCALI